MFMDDGSQGLFFSIGVIFKQFFLFLSWSPFLLLVWHFSMLLWLPSSPDFLDNYIAVYHLYSTCLSYSQALVWKSYSSWFPPIKSLCSAVGEPEIIFSDSSHSRIQNSYMINSISSESLFLILPIKCNDKMCRKRPLRPNLVSIGISL